MTNNGNFITWPGIEGLQFGKGLGTAKVSELTHLDQERKNLQPTQDSDEEVLLSKVLNTEQY